jgi:hypothetical protein
MSVGEGHSGFGLRPDSIEPSSCCVCPDSIKLNSQSLRITIILLHLREKVITWGIKDVLAHGIR